MGERLQIRVVAAVIEEDGRYLITQRSARAVLPLLWEFPGGRVEEAETDAAALVREVRGRIGVTVEVGDKIGEHHHAYDDYDVHLTTYACRIPEGQVPRTESVMDLRWVRSSELADYRFPPADQRTMNLLLGHPGN